MADKWACVGFWRIVGGKSRHGKKIVTGCSGSVNIFYMLYKALKSSVSAGEGVLLGWQDRGRAQLLCEVDDKE